jgi:hypothetical protein
VVVEVEACIYKTNTRGVRTVVCSRLCATDLYGPRALHLYCTTQHSIFGKAIQYSVVYSVVSSTGRQRRRRHMHDTMPHLCYAAVYHNVHSNTLEPITALPPCSVPTEIEGFVPWLPKNTQAVLCSSRSHKKVPL